MAARGLGGMWGGCTRPPPSRQTKEPSSSSHFRRSQQERERYPKTRQRVDSAAACSFCMEAGLYAAAAGSSAEPRDSEGSVLAFQLALARCTNNSAWPRG